MPTPLTLALPDGTTVSALLDAPPHPRAVCVLAHGAGSDMTHPWLAAVAQGLAGRGLACLRYRFPSRERGLRRPDPPALAHATVRAAVAQAQQRLPGLPLVAGGKSFGARMSSQAQALAPLPGVRGLVFLGFPLHPAGQPATERADHLDRVQVPMLFLQGTRDALAQFDLVQSVAARLGERATLHAVDGADHAFHVPARSGRSDAQVLAELLDTLRAWVDALDGGR